MFGKYCRLQIHSVSVVLFISTQHVLYVMFWSVTFLFMSVKFITFLFVLCFCGCVCLCTWLSFFFVCFVMFLSMCMKCIFPSVFACVVCLCTVLPPHPTILPATRDPGGECRRWLNTGGRGRPRDQCDWRERRANGQWRLPAATLRRTQPPRRLVGGLSRGQHGLPRSRLRKSESGGQEAEVCEANGGEWGFWVGLRREEPVLRPNLSSP